MRNSDNSNALIGFMAGAGIGAGLALLFAPRSGVRTRVLLARKTRKGTEYVKQQADAVLGSASELIEKGEKELATRKEGLRRAIEFGKRAYREAAG